MFHHPVSGSYSSGPSAAQNCQKREVFTIVHCHPVLPDRLTVPRILSLRKEGRRRRRHSFQISHWRFTSGRSGVRLKGGREGGRGPFVEIIAHGEGRKERTDTEGRTSERTSSRHVELARLATALPPLPNLIPSLPGPMDGHSDWATHWAHKSGGSKRGGRESREGSRWGG